MIPLCLDQGIAIIPWSPLARGFVMGNRGRDKSGATARARGDTFAHSMYYREVDFTIADRVGEVAQRLGVSRAQVALAWLLQKPGVSSPVVGTTTLVHLEDLVRAVEVTLSVEDIAQLELPYQPKCVLGF